MAFGTLLDRVRVAAPCSADWKEMRGDERVRFCDRCSLNVYNLSAMTRREAERLVVRSEGQLCVRFYRRADGTTLTRNCPVGLRALKRRVSRVATGAAAAALSFFAGVGVAPDEEPSQPFITPAPIVVDAAEVGADEFEMTMGASGSMISPYGEQVVSAGFLASVIFLFGYPVLKIRERKQARQRESLHIWRNS